jgi:hypothetical protein
MKRFQTAVKVARKEWKVPTNGFKRDDRAEAYKQLFWNGRKDYKRNNYLNFYDELIPPTILVRSELRKLSRQFNLDYRWHGWLFFYILGNTVFDPPPEGANLEVRLNEVRLPEKDWVVTSLKIEIYQDTTMGDIRKILPRIKKYQKMMPAYVPKRRRTSSNIDRYIKVRELEDLGKSHEEIARIKELGFSDDPRAVGYLKDDLENRFSSKKFKKIRRLTYR